MSAGFFGLAVNPKGNAMANTEHDAEVASAADRRKFLASCGKFAVITPPAITLMLSTSLTSTAVMASGGRSSGPGNSDFGHSHNDKHDKDHDKD